MRGFFLTWAVNICALLAVATLGAGIHVSDWQTLAVSALVLGLVNATLRPMLLVWTLPFNILSLGLLTLFINGFLFYAVSKLVTGFTVDNFWSAFWGALLFSLVSFVLNLFVNPQGKVNIRYYRDATADRKQYRDVIDVEAKEEKPKNTEKKGRG
jgi:putative membrane protein